MQNSYIDVCAHVNVYMSTCTVFVHEVKASFHQPILHSTLHACSVVHSIYDRSEVPEQAKLQISCTKL